MALSNAALSAQIVAALVTLLGSIVVVSVVLFLLMTSSPYEDKTIVKAKVYKARGRYFYGLSAVIVALLAFTLQLLPYQRYQSAPNQIVTVVAMQWAWKIGPGLSNESPIDFSGESEITLPVNKAVKFIVTSADVNHNFAIYDSDGVLVAQVQAMPDYKNELQHTFAKPGEYTVLCLEYCGGLHAGMVGKINVE